MNSPMAMMSLREMIYSRNKLNSFRTLERDRSRLFVSIVQSLQRDSFPLRSREAGGIWTDTKHASRLSRGLSSYRRHLDGRFGVEFAVPAIRLHEGDTFSLRSEGRCGIVTIIRQWFRRSHRCSALVQQRRRTRGHDASVMHLPWPRDAADLAARSRAITHVQLSSR
jgi:hypothetical protein